MIAAPTPTPRRDLARRGRRAPQIKGRGKREERIGTEPHLTPRCSPTRVAATAIPVSATMPRHPPTQAAKKCRIGPQPVPVPPAESPVDGAGAQWGRKDGPPDSYLGPLNPHGSPFFFGFQKPFFFQQGSETGFEIVSFLQKRMLIGICPNNITFPPMGGRCPAGADEGALDRTEREIHFTSPPSSVICSANATFPLGGGRFYKARRIVAPHGS